MPRSVVHIELPAQDTSRSRRFWSSLCGFEFQSYDGPVEYHMFQGSPGGGIYPSQAGEQEMIVYFESEDLEADLARVRELGGETEDKSPVPGMGWYARCRDSEGVAFSLWQPDDSAPAPAA